MKNPIFKIAPYIFLFFLVCACTQSDAVVERHVPQDAIEVAVSFSIPGTSGVVTRGLSEDDQRSISSMHVLVFRNDEYQYTTEGHRNENNDGTYMIKLPQGVELTLVAVANAEQMLSAAYANGDLEVGKSKADVLSAFVLKQSSVWPTTGGGRFLPMWGEKVVTIHSSDALLNDGAIRLIRMHAAINVVTASDREFELEEVYFYRYSQYGTLVPDRKTPGVWDSEQEKALHPSEPSMGYGTIDDYLSYPVTDGACLNEIYLPEAPAGSEANYADSPCLVVKGKYMGKTSFYRVDIGNKHTDGTFTFLPLLRNHQYLITIQNPEGVGESSVDAAANSKFPLRTASVISWDESELSNVEYRKGYILGVSATAITLPSTAVAETDGVQLAIVHNSDPTISGEAGTAVDGITYTKASGTNETVLTFAAESNNNSVNPRSRTVTVSLGDINYSITITQSGATPEIKVYDKNGKEIKLDENGEYAIEYTPYNKAEILDGFRVEWTPADLPLQAKYVDGGTDGTDETYKPTNMENITSSGRNEIKKTAKEFTGGVKNFRLNLKGIGAHNTTDESYDGRVDQAATITLKVGGTAKQFTLRAWTPYAAWVNADETFSGSNLPTSTKKTKRLRHNVDVTMTTTVSTAAVRPQSETPFISSNTTFTVSKRGVMQDEVSINTPTQSTYHNFAGRKETHVIKTLTNRRGTTYKNSVELECKDDCGAGEEKVSYIYHNNQLIYGSVAGGHCWMTHDLGSHNKLYSYSDVQKNPCPPGFVVPTAAMGVTAIGKTNDLWDDVGTSNKLNLFCQRHEDSQFQAESATNRKYIAMDLRDETERTFDRYALFLTGRGIAESNANRITWFGSNATTGIYRECYAINGYYYSSSTACACLNGGLPSREVTWVASNNQGNIYYNYTNYVLPGGGFTSTITSLWGNIADGYNWGRLKSRSYGTGSVNYEGTWPLTTVAKLPVRCVSTKAY